MRDPCFNTQWPFNSFDDQLTTFGDNTHHFCDNALPIFDHYKPITEPSPRASKQLKTSSWNLCISSDQFIMNPTPHYRNDSYVSKQANVVSSKEEDIVSSNSTIGFTYDTSPSSHVQFHSHNYNHQGGSAKKVATTINTYKFNTPEDHILAERKRRVKLSQRFIALSALIPGLKKVKFGRKFLVGGWKVADLNGLSGEGRKAQEYVCGLPSRIRRLEKRASALAKEGPYQSSGFLIDK